MYGTQPPEYKWVPGRFIVLHGASGQRLHTFDLEALLKPANIEAGAGNFVWSHIKHAVYHQGIVYAAIAHATYASSTEGGTQPCGHSRGNGRGGLAEPAALRMQTDSSGR